MQLQELRRDAALCQTKIQVGGIAAEGGKATCLAWSAMMETPTFDMPIIQPMLTAVSLTQNKGFSIVIEVADAPGSAGAHDGL